MRADLHLHSVYSDGLYTPDEICFRAVKAGVELISITDHDCMNGEEEKRAAAKKYGLNYLSGWEISAYEGLTKIHITGYNCEKGEHYQNFLKLRVALSYERARDSLKKLQKLGISVPLEIVLDGMADKSAPVHTMHLSRAVERATGIPFDRAYEEYLAPGKPAFSALGRPTPKQAIECIHLSGGIASIAHPGRLTLSFSEREKTIYRLKELGVDGIEAYYTTHTNEETAYFSSLAKELSLLKTGGSDTHFEEQTHKIGYPVFYADEELLSRVKIL